MIGLYKISLQKNSKVQNFQHIILNLYFLFKLCFLEYYFCPDPSQNRLFEGLEKKTPPLSWPGGFLMNICEMCRLGGLRKTAYFEGFLKKDTTFALAGCLM